MIKFVNQNALLEDFRKNVLPMYEEYLINNATFKFKDNDLINIDIEKMGEL